jgi:ornithine cyclodeaminase/alanine dehydrogenase
MGLVESVQAAQALNGKPLFVSAQASATVLSWDDVIGRLRQAYSVPHDNFASPPRVVARSRGAWMRALAAAPPTSRYMGAKIFGMGRSKTVNYIIVLLDQETGMVAGLVDGNLVTAYRTAATSAAAIDRIAPPRSAVLGVLGSGLEAQMHVRAIAAVRPISSLNVFSPTPARREAFADTFGRELGVPCTAVDSARAAVDSASLVLAAARSFDETPILLGEWLEPGMTVVSIGSTLPEQREIDTRTVEICDLIVCDAVEEVIEETGDMLAAKAAGVDFEQKIVSLNDLMCGAVSDRLASAQLPMFKSIGAAIQDVIVAELVLERAIERGIATPLPIEFLLKTT